MAMTMLDKIFSEGLFLPPGHEERIRGIRRRHRPGDPEVGIGNILGDAVAFSIENVTEYVFSKKSTNCWDWDHGDFPNVAPPYPSMWIETKTNEPGILSHRSEVNINVSRIGYAITSQRQNILELSVEDIAWTVSAYLFYQEASTGNVIGPVATISLRVNSHGRLLICPDEADELDSTHDASWWSYMDFDIINWENRDASDWYLGHGIIKYLPAILIAISFMHCKNVRIRSNEPKITRKQKKRLGDFRGVKYHTLEIEPMKRIIEREGNVSHNGLSKALHICRGHFKDYSNGMGLFGKYKGMYWWPDHVRGTSDAGIVVKDYAVTP